MIFFYKEILKVFDYSVDSIKLRNILKSNNKKEFYNFIKNNSYDYLLLDKFILELKKNEHLFSNNSNLTKIYTNIKKCLYLVEIYDKHEAINSVKNLYDQIFFYLYLFHYEYISKAKLNFYNFQLLKESLKNDVVKNLIIKHLMNIGSEIYLPENKYQILESYIKSKSDDLLLKIEFDKNFFIPNKIGPKYNNYPYFVDLDLKKFLIFLKNFNFDNLVNFFNNKKAFEIYKNNLEPLPKSIIRIFDFYFRYYKLNFNNIVKIICYENNTKYYFLKEDNIIEKFKFNSIFFDFES